MARDRRRSASAPRGTRREKRYIIDITFCAPRLREAVAAIFLVQKDTESETRVERAELQAHDRYSRYTHDVYTFEIVLT